MKSKLISLLLVISLLLNGALIAYADGGIESDPYFEGSGTEADPYLIGTAEDLIQLSSLSNAAETGITYADKYYRLTADIDMEGVDYKPICYGTNMSTPANGGGADGRFSGTLDGGGHVIQNVSIPASYLSVYGATAGIIGLLGANGTVKKLGVENMTVTTGNANRLCIGGLAGSLLAGISIHECYVRGMTVNGAAIVNSSSFAYVGGIAGRTIGNSGSITNCYSTGLSYTLSNANYSAGILGSCGNVAYSAANCYTTHEKTDGYASATNSYLSKSNCYVSADLADIQAEDLGKAFVENQTEENDGYPLLAWEVGEEYDPDPTDEATEEPTEEPTSTPEPTADPDQTDPNFKGSGTEADPFLIRSANDLTTLASLTNAAATAGNYANQYYRLTADIDMAGVSYKPISYGTSMYTAQGARFTGTLDGDGHIIKNITINTNLATYGATAGIIGILGTDGMVKNLGVENMSITTTANSTYMCIGGIAASLMANMSIDRCYVKGMTVSATNAGSPCYVGGLVGRTIGNAGTITNSYSTNLAFTVTNDTTHSAGIMGACGNTGYSATNCYTTHAKIEGNVAATNSYLTKSNCYKADTITNITPANLGEAFDADEALFNDGLPILVWEYDVQHPETATYDITVNGEEISDGQENVPASHELVVTFDRAMNSDTLGNISLLKNGQKMENLEFRLSGNVLTIAPPLEFGTRYTLFIPKTVQSVKDGEGMSAKAEEKNITFMTVNTLALKEIKLNGKAVSEAEIRAGDEVAAEVKVKNANAFGSQNAAVIVALYDKSGVMKYAAFDTVKIPKSGEAALSATLHIPDSMEEGFEISVMVWDSAWEMNAVCRAHSHE